jgi:hypothetical protein
MADHDIFFRRRNKRKVRILMLKYCMEINDDIRVSIKTENNESSPMIGFRIPPPGFMKATTRKFHRVIYDMTCPICTFDYKKGETIVWARNKTCKHTYHKQCLLNWFDTKEEKDWKCPVCRSHYMK